MTATTELNLVKHPGRSWGLELVNGVWTHYFNLKRLLNNGFFKDIHAFQQSDSGQHEPLWKQEDIILAGGSVDYSYYYLEFWTNNQDKILQLCTEAVAIIGNGLTLTLV